MITLCRRSFVSILVTMIFALGACASAASRPTPNRPAATLADLLSIRFENESLDQVDVYLIGEKREWNLGRVAPGAVVSLQLPDEAFVRGSATVQLAVLAGQPRTFTAARNPRAVLTIAEPASTFLSQRWTFSHGNLIPQQY